MSHFPALNPDDGFEENVVSETFTKRYKVNFFCACTHLKTSKWILLCVLLNVHHLHSPSLGLEACHSLMYSLLKDHHQFAWYVLPLPQ